MRTRQLPSAARLTPAQSHQCSRRYTARDRIRQGDHTRRASRTIAMPRMQSPAGAQSGRVQRRLGDRDRRRAPRDRIRGKVLVGAGEAGAAHRHGPRIRGKVLVGAGEAGAAHRRQRDRQLGSHQMLEAIVRDLHAFRATRDSGRASLVLRQGASRDDRRVCPKAWIFTQCYRAGGSRGGRSAKPNR